MIQSIQAGSTAIYNTAKTAVASGKVAISQENTTAAAAQNEDENTQTSEQGDTLTLSNSGVQAAKTWTAQSANRPSSGVTSEDSYTDATAQALSSAAAGVGITETTAAETEASADSAAVSGTSSSSSTDSSLSSYTEAELKEMLENGEITQAEYDAEIESRSQTDSTSDDEESETAAVAGAGATEA